VKYYRKKTAAFGENVTSPGVSLNRQVACRMAILDSFIGANRHSQDGLPCVGNTG
jgi:hypothetical protein